MIHNKIIFLVGLPGSGKSTYAQDFSEKDFIHITSDGVREELFGNASIQTDHNKVFTIMRERTKEAIANGYNVIYDATNIARKHRINFIRAFKGKAILECHIIWADISTCIERDKMRSRVVGIPVIDRMIRQFETPYYDEGWDLITLIQNDPIFRIEDAIPKYIDNLSISHNNPHHRLSILEHMTQAAALYAEETQDNEDDFLLMQSALILHDIGKPYTRTFINSKGNITDEAHYYSHENVGAYIALGLIHDIKISWVICHHMDILNRRPYYTTLDAEHRNILETVYKYDMAAH